MQTRTDTHTQQQQHEQRKCMPRPILINDRAIRKNIAGEDTEIIWPDSLLSPISFHPFPISLYSVQNQIKHRIFSIVVVVDVRFGNIRVERRLFFFSIHLSNYHKIEFIGKNVSSRTLCIYVILGSFVFFSLLPRVFNSIDTNEL